MGLLCSSATPTEKCSALTEVRTRVGAIGKRQRKGAAFLVRPSVPSLMGTGLRFLLPIPAEESTPRRAMRTNLRGAALGRVCRRVAVFRAHLLPSFLIAADSQCSSSIPMEASTAHLETRIPGGRAGSGLTV